MYNVDAVERIMREQNKNFSDLAEYILKQQHIL